LLSDPLISQLGITLLTTILAYLLM